MRGTITSSVSPQAAAFATAALLLPIALPAQQEPPDEPPPAAQYAAPTGIDRIGRVLADVAVNDRGPYRFVVDTGANRTAISSRLAAALGLVLDPASMVEVHGITGSARVPAVSGTRLVVGEITLDPQQLPILEDVVFADADGILGVEGLQNTRVEVDFENDVVTLRPSTGRRAPAGYLVIPARLEKGGLMLVRGRVGKVQADVILDTGAQRTIGNLALHRALLQSLARKDTTVATVTGATPGVVTAIAVTTPPIAIGDARLKDVAVTFADLHVFTLWELIDEPALVVGMDVLGTVDRFVVDYGRREFQLRPRGAGDVAVRNCNHGGCGTRLPTRR